MLAPHRAGIVEGFFSLPLPPWRWDERFLLLRFLGEFAPHLNTYLYCPKDDPYVRTHWDREYPPAERVQLAEFIAACRRQRVRFIFGFNPEIPAGAPDEHERRSWAERIRRKADSLRAIGCEHFCLLFDDVPLSYDAVEKRLEHADEAAALFFDFADRACRIIGDTPWLCTPDYCLCRPSALTRQLSRLPAVPLIWTGRGVFVPQVTTADLADVRATMGDAVRLVYWSNYPVNDVEQDESVLNLGGFPAPEANAAQGMEAMLVNPMRQCFANLPLYVTFSDYLHAPRQYARARSWHTALEAVLGVAGASVALIFEQFSSCSVVDVEPKHMWHSLSSGEALARVKEHVRAGLETIEHSPLPHEYAALFLRACERPLLEAWRFCSFAEKTQRGRRISAAEFTAGDRFPTVCTAPRHIKEIAEIVATRLMLGPPPSHEIAQVVAELAPLAGDFDARYPGQARLTITDTDARNYRTAIDRLVSAEQQHMLTILNNHTLPPAERLTLYALRQSTNRFTAARNARRLGQMKFGSPI